MHTKPLSTEQIKMGATKDVHAHRQVNMCDKHCTWKEFLKEIKVQVVVKMGYETIKQVLQIHAHIGRRRQGGT